MNKFYDFSSGKGGTVLAFIRNYFRCSESEAVEKLQQYAGANGVVAPRRRMEATKVAKRFAPRKRRGKADKTKILPDDYMSRYIWRDDKLDLWRQEGISDESMRKFQVAYDDFSDRIVYPIRNMDGKIISVSGRTVDPDWKEKGLRKYTYFQSLGTVATIFGAAESMESVRETGEIILFEGAKSVFIMDSWGYHNTGAVLTSHLNPNQLKILAKLGVRVVFALDKGVNIREDENIKRLRRYVTVEYVWDKDDLLEDKMSPVDAGREVWERLYEGRYRYR